jgi:hypothetical protein
LRDSVLNRGRGDATVVNMYEGDGSMEKVSTQKRQYTTPMLTVHGTLEEVTKQQNKGFGSSDGYLFQGVPITNIS